VQAAPGGAPGAGALGAPPRRGEAIIKGLLFAAATVSVLTTLGIVASLIGETFIFFSEVGVFEFLLGTEWSPLFADPQFGVLPLVFGTLMVTAIALLVAIPLGLGSAIYLSEYAPARVRKVLKPVLEVLAGIPTIVFGYFALTFFTPEVLQGLLGLEVDGFNALGAGIIMGFLVLPTIASVAEDAMSAVPGALREGAYGLGGSRLQVSLRVVLPAALSGVVAAIVLGASRAIGETVIVLVAGGLVPDLSPNPGVSHETMTAFIAATAGGEVPAGSIGYLTIFAVGATLFAFTLILNVISIRFVRRYRQVYE
jgi:phosphate transport system permease protein